MKKTLTIVALVCSHVVCYAQALIYEDGQLKARGHISSLATNTIGIRTFEQNKFKNKSFFKSSIDSLVLLDSTSVAEYYANLDLYPAKTIIRIERSEFDFRSEYQPADSPVQLSLKNTIPSEILQRRMFQADKHVRNATTSLLLCVATGLVGTLVVTNMAGSATTTGQIQDAAVVSIGFGAVSFGLFINTLIQNTKASTLLKVQ